MLMPGASRSQSLQPPSLPRNNFGGAGMIEMPSARFAHDGELSFGASFFKNTQHYNLGYEIFPWLEGSFRYSGLQHFDPLYPVYYDRSFALKMRLWDETNFWPALAIGANDVVGTGAYSGEYLVTSKHFGPIDATLGIGWGRLSSAGQFQNPLTHISHSFENRAHFPDIVPGATAFSTLFHGAYSGIFGGLVYQTPLDGLSLVAEYSSDAYRLESSRGSFTPRSQFNYGASYQMTDSVSVGISWLYGHSVSANISFAFDPARPQYPQKIDVPAVTEVIRTSEQQQKGVESLLHRMTPTRMVALAHVDEKNSLVDALWRQSDIVDVFVRGTIFHISLRGRPSDTQCRKLARFAASEAAISQFVVAGPTGRVSCDVPHTLRLENLTFRDSAVMLRNMAEPLMIDASAVEVDPQKARLAILSDAAKQHLHIDAVTFEQGRATIYYGNFHYQAEADAIDRLVRILMADAPTDIEEFRLISVGAGIPQREFDVLRSPAERNFEQTGNINLFDGPLTQKPPPISNPSLQAAETDKYPNFDWGLFPQFHQALFDPNNPFGVQFLGAAFVSIDLLPGLSLHGEGELSFYDNFDTTRRSDSQLPHVRTDFVNYFTEGKNGIGQLEADYRFRTSPTVQGIIRAGILEGMFDGVGGELLWRPEGARWGIGVDAYQVWQRGFDRLWATQSYHAFTGHISLYYQAPWYNLNFALRAGQYLAGDRGVTLEITRRFSTGVEIGAFVTRTNVSAAQFGEGSFDKGLIIRIPLGWIAPIESQSDIAIDLRPVQRDGGQRLLGDVVLWNDARRMSEGEILNTNTQ
jgi:hypothetical protein